MVTHGLVAMALDEFVARGLAQVTMNALGDDFGLCGGDTHGGLSLKVQGHGRLA